MPTAERTNDKVFFPNLDGLRFIAFLCIFFSHSFYSESPEVLNSAIYHTVRYLSKNGILGVNLFFVLSGFLITYLLLDERKKTGKIHIGSFYMRRILRIWPLYYAIVILGFYIVPFVMEKLGEAYLEPTRIEWYIFFINNLFSTKPATAVLGILWSIAVEEQFYLFWPLIIAFVPRKFYFYIFSLLIGVSIVLRAMNKLDYEHTLNCVPDLVIGSWIAVLAFEKHKLIKMIASFPKILNATIYLTGFVLIFTYSDWGESVLHPVARIILACFFGYIIIEQNYSPHSWYKMSKRTFSTYFGKYTYGLYMLHFPVIYVVGRIFRSFAVDNLFNALFTSTALTLALVLLAADASYHLYEKPFLKLKQRFSHLTR